MLMFIKKHWWSRGAASISIRLLTRVVGSDTASFMVRVVWDILQEDYDTKHIFFVPCDPHSLLLLVDDIVKNELYI